MSETEKEKELEELRKRCEDLERQQRASERERKQLAEDNSALREAAGGREAPPAAAGGISAGAGASAAGGAADEARPSGSLGEGMQDFGGFARDSTFLRRVMGSDKSPPKFPPPAGQLAWLRAMRDAFVLAGLDHTLTEDPTVGPVCVINCLDRSTLLARHTVNIVDDHTRAYALLSEAVAGSDVAERLMSCATVAEAWEALQSWVLPTTEAQKLLLEAELNNISLRDDSDPKYFFAEMDKLAYRLRVAGIVKTPQQLVSIALRRLPAKYDVQKAILRDKPNVTRKQVEDM